MSAGGPLSERQCRMIPKCECGRRPRWIQRFRQLGASLHEEHDAVLPVCTFCVDRDVKREKIVVVIRLAAMDYYRLINFIHACRYVALCALGRKQQTAMQEMVMGANKIAGMIDKNAEIEGL